MILEESGDRVRLIRGNREEVIESASAEDNLFAGALGIIDGISGINLGCANGGEEGTCYREARVEFLAIACDAVCNDECKYT